MPMSDWFRKDANLQKLRITFLHGETDFFKREHSDILISDGVLKQSTVIEIPGAGHHPYMDTPEVSVRLILESMRKNESKTELKQVS